MANAYLIAGYAAIWGSISGPYRNRLGDNFRNEFRPGCFRQWLARRPGIIACLNHDTEALTIGPAEAWEDDRGLAFAVEVPDTVVGGLALKLVRLDQIAGCSLLSFAQASGLIEEHAGGGFFVRPTLQATVSEITLVIKPKQPAHLETAGTVRIIPPLKRRIVSA
jgi:HK97 family phage prohead protease